MGRHYLEGMDAVTVMANRSVSRDEMEKRVELGNRLWDTIERFAM